MIPIDRSQRIYVGKVTSNGKTRYFYSEGEYTIFLNTIRSPEKLVVRKRLPNTCQIAGRSITKAIL